MGQRLHTRLVGGDINRNTRYDYVDDGTRFEGYDYKGCIPITRAAGAGFDECFIVIRPDYTSEIPWSMSMWRLCEYFNGVPRESYDRKVLIAIYEYLYQRYFEKNPHPDTDGLPERCLQLIEEVK